jgi:hypothetical protein
MEPDASAEGAAATKERVEAIIAKGAATISKEDDDAKTPRPPGELLQIKSADAEDAIEKEITKSYSIAFVGIDQPLAANAPNFDDGVQRLLQAFDGPVAVLLNGTKALDGG